MIIMAIPLKNSVSKGVGSLAFGIQGTNPVELLDNNSTLSVRMGGSGTGDAVFDRFSSI
jgi:hypothetical protein